MIVLQLETKVPSLRYRGKEELRQESRLFGNSAAMSWVLGSWVGKLAGYTGVWQQRASRCSSERIKQAAIHGATVRLFADQCYGSGTLLGPGRIPARRQSEAPARRTYIRTPGGCQDELCKSWTKSPLIPPRLISNLSLSRRSWNRGCVLKTFSRLDFPLTSFTRISSCSMHFNPRLETIGRYYTRSYLLQIWVSVDFLLKILTA